LINIITHLKIIDTVGEVGKEGKVGKEGGVGRERGSWGHSVIFMDSWE